MKLLALLIAVLAMFACQSQAATILSMDFDNNLNVGGRWSTVAMEINNKSGNSGYVADTADGSAASLRIYGLSATGATGDYVDAVLKTDDNVANASLISAHDNATPLTAITLQAWVKMEALPQNYPAGIVGIGANNNALMGAFLEINDAGKVYSKTRQGNYGTDGNVGNFNVTSTGELSLNTWHHIAASIDLTEGFGTTRIYIDGVLDSTVVSTVDLSGTSFNKVQLLSFHLSDQWPDVSEYRRRDADVQRLDRPCPHRRYCPRSGKPGHPRAGDVEPAWPGARRPAQAKALAVR